MKVTVAEPSGFCFGVERAVSLARKAAREGPCYSLGPLIHNRRAVALLEKEGVRVVSSPEELPPGATVILRSHGVTEDELARLDGCTIVDATCPDVRRIHKLVCRYADRHVLILGDKNHAEVRGTASRCARFSVISGETELQTLLASGEITPDTPLLMVAQTTASRPEWEKCALFAKKLCTNIEILDTICGETSRRQRAAAQLAAQCDAMLVVGDRTSSNSCHLAEVCQKECRHVFLVESADNLRELFTPDITSVGITAGASSPAWVIKEVYQTMTEEMKGVSIPETENSVSVSDTGEGPAADVAQTPVLDAPAEASAQPEVSAPSEAPAQPEAVSSEPEASAQPEAVSSEPEASAQPEAASSEPETSAQPEAASSEPETFEQMLERSLKTLLTGDKVTGVITAVTPTEIHVDLGAKHAGYIPVTELSDDPSYKPEESLHVGDEIETYVLRVNDVEGTAMLSKKRLDTVQSWEDVEAARESHAVLEGIVTEENKGGVVVSIRGVRVFVPASQTGLPKDAPMSSLLKTKVKLRITEINRARRRVVGSIRSVMAETRRLQAETLWETIEAGKVYDGVVKSMTSYGAFVDIGGSDGMVHVSELSWNRIKHPSEVVKIGDPVQVTVIAVDKEKKKISLGYKKESDNPWNQFLARYKAGDVARVKVVKLMPFGAFCEVLTGVDGLIHISQLSDRRVGKPADVVAEGQEVDVKIVEIDHDRHKISLSIRALLEEVSASDEERAEQPDEIVAVSETPPAAVQDDAAETDETPAEQPTENE